MFELSDAGGICNVQNAVGADCYPLEIRGSFGKELPGEVRADGGIAAATLTVMDIFKSVFPLWGLGNFAELFDFGTSVDADGGLIE